MWRWLAVAVALALFSGCKEKPEEAYKRLVFLARTGNEAAFVDSFTPDSQRLVKTLLALRKAYGDRVDARSDPYLSIVLENIVSAEVSQKDVAVEGSTASVKRDVATLVVSDGKIQRTLHMVRLDDGWKIDALDLQHLWQDPKQFARKE